MGQQRVSKQKNRRSETVADETTTDATNPELAAKTEETLDQIDDVLDDQLDAELLDAMDEVMGTAFTLGVFLGATVALIGLNTAYRHWKGIA